ncbi:hypothetical protein OROMI_023215 [Orobanche minor]
MLWIEIPLRTTSSPRPLEPHVNWKPLPDATIKLDFDGSIHKSSPEICIVVVARDVDVHIITWARKTIRFIQNVEVAEALAAQEAVKIATTFNFRDIIVEGDCLGVMQQLQQVDPSLSLAGGIIIAIKR